MVQGNVRSAPPAGTHSLKYLAVNQSKLSKVGELPPKNDDGIGLGDIIKALAGADFEDVTATPRGGCSSRTSSSRSTTRHGLPAGTVSPRAAATRTTRSRPRPATWCSTSPWTPTTRTAGSSASTRPHRARSPTTSGTRYRTSSSPAAPRTSTSRATKSTSRVSRTS